jgi:hypothetical protein
MVLGTRRAGLHEVSPSSLLTADTLKGAGRPGVVLESPALPGEPPPTSILGLPLSVVVLLSVLFLVLLAGEVWPGLLFGGLVGLVPGWGRCWFGLVLRTGKVGPRSTG